MTHSFTLTEIEEKKLTEMYLAGKASTELAKIYKCSVPTILNLLRKSKVQIRSLSKARRKYLVNETCFDCWNNDSAYFIGLLMADGYNSQNNGFIRLAVQVGDEEILNKLNSFLQSNKPLYYYKNMVTLHINSKHISNRLADIGIIQNKTHYCKFPDVPSKFIFDFLRGYFDGDGGLFQSQKIKSNVAFTVVGNYDLIIKYQEHLINLIGLSKTKLVIHNSPNSNIVSLRYGGKNNLRKIYNLFYSSGSIFLNRKYLKFKEILN